MKLKVIIRAFNLSIASLSIASWSIASLSIASWSIASWSIASLSIASYAATKLSKRAVNLNVLRDLSTSLMFSYCISFSLI